MRFTVNNNTSTGTAKVMRQCGATTWSDLTSEFCVPVLNQIFWLFFVW